MINTCLIFNDMTISLITFPSIMIDLTVLLINFNFILNYFLLWFSCFRAKCVTVLILHMRMRNFSLIFVKIINSNNDIIQILATIHTCFFLRKQVSYHSTFTGPFIY